MMCVAAAIAAVPHGQSHAQQWAVEEKSDPLTDERVVTASVAQRSGTSTQVAIVRCQGSKFEVYFDFGAYLSNGNVPVRYRLDRSDVVAEDWNPSARGTAAFAKHPTELARAMLSASGIVVEAQDFRGQPHRASFPLSDARTAIIPAMELCKVSSQAPERQVEGLRRETVLEMEKWGPRTKMMAKRIMTSLGLYAGAMETDVAPEFAFQVQQLYDDYIEQCKAHRVDDVHCRGIHISIKHGSKPSMPPMYSVLHTLAPPDLKAEAGKLRIID